MLFGLIPREEAFFELFKKAAHNMIEGSRLLKVMMEDFRSPVEQARGIKDVEHVGDGITHDIARRLNKTFITPIDREDIHDLASALDDILDVTEAIADRFVLYKVTKPTEMAIKLADILVSGVRGRGARCGPAGASASGDERMQCAGEQFGERGRPYSLAMRFRPSSKKKPIRWRSSSGKKFTRASKREPTGAKTSRTFLSASR